MQFLLFKEEKFYALGTLKDKNFAPKQNERDCPMTNVQMQVFLPLFMRFLLMISGSRKVTVKRENMETEHE